MKRQRGRNRSGGGNGKPQQNANRAFESNGPDGVKIRGAAQHVYEKYQQLARDALTSGDRVLGESYQQHAEHYFRVLRAMQPQRPASDIIGRDAFASGFDIDFEDEDGSGDGGDDGEVQDSRDSRGGEGGQHNRFEGRRDDRNRDDRPRDDRSRDDRPRDDRPREDRPRDDRPRDDRSRDRGFSRDDRNFNRDDRNRDRDDRPRDDRPRDDRPRDDRPRDDRPRDDRPRSDRHRDRDDRPQRDDRSQGERRFERVDPLTVVEPQATPLPTAAEASSPMLRSHDGEVSHAPAFLQARPESRPAAETAETPADEAPRTPRPRRRRTPRTFEAGEAAGPTPDATEDA